MSTKERVHVKICGVTSIDDATMCVREGADSIGINFWKGSPRYCDEITATRIAEAVKGKTRIVGVFVDDEFDHVAHIRDRVQLDCVQLHGHEAPELLAQFLPHAYKAFRLRDEADIAVIEKFEGQYVLVDAYVEGAMGGTGLRADWSLAAKLTKSHKVILAGGLTPANVASAIRTVRPFCVDVASGVESNLRKKDEKKVRAFIEAVRAA